LHAARAWLGGDAAAAAVHIDIADGAIAGVTAGVAAPADARRLPGLTVPGLVNAHSHVFHRAIRGHTVSLWSRSR
jgi:cytosine/adenosine deaminase-related metal-dependent hydrolase